MKSTEQPSLTSKSLYVYATNSDEKKDESPSKVDTRGAPMSPEHSGLKRNNSDDNDALEDSSPEYISYFSSPHRAYHFQRQTQTLEERRLQKVRRNQEALSKLLEEPILDLDVGKQTNKGALEDKSNFGQEIVDNATVSGRCRRRGMLGLMNQEVALRKDQHTVKQNNPIQLSMKDQLEELQQQIPFRAKQIQLLFDLLHSTVLQQQEQQQDSSLFLPPQSIFCIGSGGTGKTLVLKQVLRIIANSSSKYAINVIPAFVDCSLLGNESYSTSTLDSSLVGTNKSQILQSVWKDILYEIYYAIGCQPPVTNSGPKDENHRNLEKAMLSRNDVLNPQQVLDVSLIGEDSDSESELQVDDVIVLNKELKIEDQRKGCNRILTQTAVSLENIVLAGEAGNDVSDGKGRLPDGRSLEREEAKVAKNIPIPGTMKRPSKGNALPPLLQSAFLASNLSRYTTGLPGAFAKALEPVCGPGSTRKNLIVLVLDRAESVLSQLSWFSQSERNDVLGQLLLLPQFYKLNICVILVSSHGLLQYTRLHNTQEPSEFIGTLSEMIHPIRIYFNNYQGHDTFQTLLLNPYVRAQIQVESSEGNSIIENEELKHRAYKAMVNMLVSSISSATRDVREIIRLSRLLWAEAVKILQDDHGDNRKIAWKDSFHIELRLCIKRLVSHCLCEPCKSLPAVAQENCIGCKFSTAVDHRKLRGEYLRKFLLISAFLCQQNRPDHDIALFTNRRREQGKRKKLRLSQESASTEKTDSADLRRRWFFPLERLFSVFSSIVGKYAVSEEFTRAQDYDKEAHEYVSSLGSVQLYAALSDLRDLGLLVVAGQDATFQFSFDSNAKQYSCSLSYAEAHKIAEAVGFPLSQYLMTDQPKSS